MHELSLAVRDPACLKQEPGSLLGFVDKILEKARRGRVVALGRHLVSCPHIDGECLIVFHQLAEHVERRNKLLLRYL